MKRRHIVSALLGAAVGIGGAVAVQQVPKPPHDLSAQINILPENSTFDIPAGTYPGEIVLRGRRFLHLRGSGAVTITGGKDYGLKLDGGQDVDISGIKFTGSSGHGFMAVNVSGLTLSDCFSDRNAVNGFLTGDSRQVRIMNCEASGNRAGHGCYLSQRGDHYTVRENSFTGNGRCGIQVNAHPGMASQVSVIGNDLRNNANAALQMAGITDGIVSGNRTDGSRQPVVLWDDTGGRPYACRSIDLRGQDGQIKIHPLCVGIETRPGAGVPL